MKSGHKNMSKNMHTVSEDFTCKKVPEAIVNFEIFSGITMIICSSSSLCMSALIRSIPSTFGRLVNDHGARCRQVNCQKMRHCKDPRTGCVFQ